MEDNIIVELIYARDENGLKETSAKYGRLLLTVAKGILFSPEESEECVNDTYLKVWNAIPPQKPAFYKSFICKITRRLSLDRYRYNHRDKRNEENSIPLNELDCDIVSDDFTEKQLAEAALKRDINSFLKSLDATGRVLFIKRYFLLESVSSISQQLDIPENNVSVKLFRVRKELKKYLMKRGYRFE